MKRLYNEYSSTADSREAQHIETYMLDVVQRIWDEVVEDGYGGYGIYGVCPRDVEAHCHNILSTFFAQKILRRAMKKRKEEREGGR